jgi:hypothetical protein
MSVLLSAPTAAAASGLIPPAKTASRWVSVFSSSVSRSQLHSTTACRVVPRHRGATAAGKQLEPVFQPAFDLLDRQSAKAGSGELDRERQSVESPDDLDHRPHGVAVDLEVGAYVAGPVGEQLHCGVLQCFLGLGVRRRHLERRDRD